MNKPVKKDCMALCDNPRECAEAIGFNEACREWEKYINFVFSTVEKIIIQQNDMDLSHKKICLDVLDLVGKRLRSTL